MLGIGICGLIGVMELNWMQILHLQMKENEFVGIQDDNIEFYFIFHITIDIFFDIIIQTFFFLLNIW
jgi:hypothetical protein